MIVVRGKCPKLQEEIIQKIFSIDRSVESNIVGPKSKNKSNNKSNNGSMVSNNGDDSRSRSIKSIKIPSEPI